ncbi:MAG TPA: serine/threonine-protein kinase [Gammaproteobacteria bacterium]|nr:serine/threonine-protein kinase [Gammaproteobacteria bacterium]
MKKGFWTSDWFVGLAYGLVFLLIAYVIFGNGFGRAETAAYDLGVNWTSAAPDKDIAIIAIDDPSIATLGRWPWPRDYHAALFDKLTKSGADVISFADLLSEAQVDQGSVYIKDFQDFYDSSSLAAAAPFTTTPPGSTAPAPVRAPTITVPAAVHGDLVELRKRIQAASETLDSDVKLAASMKTASNVVIPMLFTVGDPLGRQSQPTPDYILRNALSSVINAPDDQQPLPTTTMTPPRADFAQVASIGFLNVFPDPDGELRQEALVLRNYDVYYPSYSLATAMKYLNLRPEDVKVMPGEGLKVGKLFISTTSDFFMRNFYYSGLNGGSPFPIFSYADVYLGKVPPDSFKGKIVIVGATAPGITSSFPTPTSSLMPPALIEANVVSSILQQNFFIAPGWTHFVTLAMLLLIIAYLAFALPRLKPSLAALISLGLVVAMLAIEFGVMKSKFVWIPLVIPVLLLITGHLLMTIKLTGMINKMLVRSEADSAESNKMLGLAFQGQGQLDMAFEKFRKCPIDDSIADLLYNLALDYERKRQFNKAGSVYHYINDFNPKFRDVAERMNRSKQMEGTVILGGGGQSASGTMILGDGTVQKPMLGRYQVEKELGKGAMGVVYLGRDPKINRVVAIKTLALSQEFDADELTEVKERFFREAETAGRLNHPNIVTIYDAGEEHDLAYIAMEFLKGKDLTGRTKGNALLTAKVALDIIAKAADALDYAHTQNVVHRDIKPANIMYDEEKGEIKVTDFGIARITDSSKTKTGMVLGTPSYMSPEQLSGKKVDGRSDLFSLGVTMYQLLAGQLPFQADSMATLMFKIANEPHAEVTVIRAELPAGVNQILDKALQKDPDKRYQRGADFAKDVRAYAAQLAQ